MHILFKIKSDLPTLSGTCAQLMFIYLFRLFTFEVKFNKKNKKTFVN